MGRISLIIPAVFSFVLSVVIAPVLIPLLKRMKVGQTVRDDGPRSHLQKSGTPTMGGILILISVTVSSLFYAGDYKRIIPILFLTLGFGLIGFLDDFIKVVLKRSMGLSPLQKIGLQILVTALFAYYMTHMADVPLAMRIPFLQGQYIDFGVWNVPLLFIAVIGSANGANLTDGLDGLLGSVTVLTAMFFFVVSAGMKSGIEPITCSVVGALFGFLLFNVHPASVFMGDTGSLALGGFLAGAAYMMQMTLYLPIVGFVYVAEVISVILQVLYFKMSGGRRLFKMAPLHHHFELCGMSEVKIVAAFSIVTALLCMISLYHA